MAEVARIRTVFTGVAGSPYYSNLFFSIVEGTEDVANQHDAVQTFWSSLASQMSADLDWQVEGEVAVIETTTDDIVRVLTAVPETGAGTATGDSLPHANQGLVRWRTNTFVAGRRIQGRTFIPGPTETNSNDGVPFPAYVTALATAAQALVADPDVALAVYSRKNGVAPTVTTASAWNQYAMLRSRRD